MATLHITEYAALPTDANGNTLEVGKMPANTLVVADTCGFHARGPSAGPTCRVEIWAYSRTNPFIPWVAPDLWRLGGVGSLRAPIFWRFGDLVERAGLGRSTWRARPDSGAFDQP